MAPVIEYVKKVLRTLQRATKCHQIIPRKRLQAHPAKLIRSALGRNLQEDMPSLEVSLLCCQFSVQLLIYFTQSFSHSHYSTFSHTTSESTIWWRGIFRCLRISICRRACSSCPIAFICERLQQVQKKKWTPQRIVLVQELLIGCIPLYRIMWYCIRHTADGIHRHTSVNHRITVVYSLVSEELSSALKKDGNYNYGSDCHELHRNWPPKQ